MASGCSGTHCEVSCGSEKVEMECPDEWINVNGSTVTCGKKPDRFPFCDKEGQPQPMNNGGTSRQARSSGDQKTVDCPPGSSINAPALEPTVRCHVETAKRLRWNARMSGST